MLSSYLVLDVQSKGTMSVHGLALGHIGCIACLNESYGLLQLWSHSIMIDRLGMNCTSLVLVA